MTSRLNNPRWIVRAKNKTKQKRPKIKSDNGKWASAATINKLSRSYTARAHTHSHAHSYNYSWLMLTKSMFNAGGRFFLFPRNETLQDCHDNRGPKAFCCLVCFTGKNTTVTEQKRERRQYQWRSVASFREYFNNWDVVRRQGRLPAKKRNSFRVRRAKKEKRTTKRFQSETLIWRLAYTEPTTRFSSKTDKNN